MADLAALLDRLKPTKAPVSVRRDIVGWTTFDSRSKSFTEGVSSPFWSVGCQCCGWMRRFDVHSDALAAATEHPPVCRGTRREWDVRGLMPTRQIWPHA